MIMQSLACETCGDFGDLQFCDCFGQFCGRCFESHKCSHKQPAMNVSSGLVANGKQPTVLFSCRPYQDNAIEAAFEQLQATKRTLIVMPTGTGKTVVFSHIAHRWPKGRIMLIAHRDELIRQGASKLEAITGDLCDIEMGEQYADQLHLNGKCRCVVTSIQTQNSGPKCRECEGKGCNNCLDGFMRRMMRFNPDDFGLVIVDEAHHSCAATYQRAINYFSRNADCRILGVTATPDRADEMALGQIFETVAFEYGILDAINDGYLVPIEQQFIHVEGLDFSEIRTVAGDLNQGQLAHEMEREEILHRMIVPLMEIAKERKTLFFTTSVKQAERGAEIANRYKPNCAEWICGTTPIDRRRELLAAYYRKDFQYLFNVGIATEGFDDPFIELVGMGRPTKSRALYSQMAGRGTRTWPGVVDGDLTAEQRKAGIAASQKPNLLILDFVGNSGKHKLVSMADVLGGKYPDEVIEHAVRRSKKHGQPEDVLKELDAAEQDLIEQRHRQRRAAIQAKAQWQSKNINPFDVLDIIPHREPGWHNGRTPSEKQVAMLEKNGIKNADKLTFVQASQLIGTIINRREQKLCSFKQAKLLSKFGEDTNVGFEEASKIIDEIAKCGWKPRMATA